MLFCNSFLGLIKYLHGSVVFLQVQHPGMQQIAILHPPLVKFPSSFICKAKEGKNIESVIKRHLTKYTVEP